MSTLEAQFADPNTPAGKALSVVDAASGREGALADTARSYQLNSRELDEVRRGTQPSIRDKLVDATAAGAAGVGAGLLTHRWLSPSTGTPARLALSGLGGLAAAGGVHSMLTSNRTREAAQPVLRDVQPMSGHLDTGNVMLTRPASQLLVPEVDVDEPLPVQKVASWAVDYHKIANLPTPPGMPKPPGLIRRGFTTAAKGLGLGVAGAAGLGALGGGAVGSAVDPKAGGAGAAVGGAAAGGAALYGLGHLGVNGAQGIAQGVGSLL